jgi:hypothetical protein
MSDVLSWGGGWGAGGPGAGGGSARSTIGGLGGPSANPFISRIGGRIAGPTIVNITFNGPIDADSSAREIEGLLRRRGVRLGATI